MKAKTIIFNCQLIIHPAADETDEASQQIFVSTNSDTIADGSASNASDREDTINDSALA